MPVAVSVAFTWAFGTTAPDGSVTVPLIAPRNVWAFAAAASAKIMVAARRKRLMFVTPTGISDFNSIFAQNHTPAALSCQAQIALATVGRQAWLVWQFR